MPAGTFPAKLTAPGRIVKRELDARGWTQKDLAAIIGRPEQTISKIITAKKSITPETALELASAFGTSPDMWVNLQAQYDLGAAMQGDRSDQVARRRRLWELLPIGEMVRRDWIKGSAAIDELESEIREWLGVRDLSEQPAIMARLRTSHRDRTSSPACVAWLRRVELLAAQRRPAGFSAHHFAEDGIRAVLSLSRSPEQVGEVPELLQSYGIVLVAVKHLPKTYIDGAAFFFDETPVIALSLRYDRIDWFWFTLMHEIAHIVSMTSRSEAILDWELDGDTDGKEEAEANRMAGDWLVPAAELRNFTSITAPFFSKASVRHFADSIGRHPGIVVGRLHHDRLIPYRNLRGFLEKVAPYLEAIMDS